ncbi:hypothetical protein LQW54_008419 [Pestalotiopsis sp. IQ-011]
MDEGTYNNVYRNASPMTPSTPSHSLQTNVNRSKTRKWVEAKKQNYDGDDWGNEYEDEEEPEVEPPGPAQQPIGFRSQLGQGAQNGASQASGNRAFSQPTAAYGHLRGQSFGRNPSGPPALHLQTQQASAPAQHFEPVEPFPAADQAPYGGAPDYRTPENVTSPQSGRPRLFGAGGSYSGRRDFSPVTQDRGAMSPAGATGLSSRFPPRKSSMGHKDAPYSRDNSRNRSGSRPEPRSDSPGQQASSATAPPNKSLPFIRPSDIYRRMEEEKDKERRSIDSAGRPSLDGVQSPGSERSTSPAHALRSPNEQRRRLSFDRDGDENLESIRGLKPTLEPVAERRSEYGLDRLVNESNTSVPIETPAKEQSSGPQIVVPSGPAGDAAPQAGLSQLLADPATRRKSLSPRLPDLARLSGFGADFFSGPSSGGVSDAAPSPQLTPPEYKSVTHDKAADLYPVTGLGLSDAIPGSYEMTSTEDNEKTAPSLIKGPALADKDETISTPRVEPSAPVDDASATPVAESQFSAVDDATVTARARPSRPSIPGGWVSESTNIASEAPTPMERPEPTVSYATVNDTLEESPVHVGEPEDLDPTTTIKQAQPLEDDAVGSVGLKDIQENENDFGETVGKHDQAVADDVLPTPPAVVVDSKELPPLQTPDPLTTSNQSVIASQQPQASEDSPFYGDSPSKYSASTHPLTATTSSGFSPTAPLNPQRAHASDADFVAPGPLARNLTMSSIDNASPHESDQLREDIIKSLSPMPTDSPSFPPFPSAADGSLTTPSSDIARESRYLSGVYDDYMGFPDDKSSPIVGQDKNEIPSISPAPLQSSPARTIVPSEPAATATPSHLTPNSNRGHRLSRQFSWEDFSTDVTPDNQQQSQAGESLATLAEPTLHVEEEEEVTSPIELRENDVTSPVLQLEAEKDGTISHTVSMMSSNAPGGLGVSGIEPPSPISVLSSPRPLESVGSRMSLADEKVLLQASSHPVSPNPEDDHPALSRTPPESPALHQDADLTVAAPKPVNITSWREILSLPTPALRIERFEEARSQYALMDSGLLNWVEHMKASTEDPTYQTLGGSPTTHAPAGASGSAQVSPTGPPTQQPYYQQYLNASNPNLVNGTPGPTRQMSLSGQPGSGFGNSKNQAAVKSKQYLQAAGAFGNKATKAGMKGGLKLFNRGKDKLRGSGDKAYQ